MSYVDHVREHLAARDEGEVPLHQPDEGCLVAHCVPEQKHCHEIETDGCDQESYGGFFLSEIGKASRNAEKKYR